MEKAKNKERLVSISEAVLLDLVAAKLKNVVLFPERLEAAKEFLENAKTKTV